MMRSARCLRLSARCLRVSARVICAPGARGGTVITQATHTHRQECLCHIDHRQRTRKRADNARGDAQITRAKTRTLTLLVAILTFAATTFAQAPPPAPPRPINWPAISESKLGNGLDRKSVV